MRSDSNKSVEQAVFDRFDDVVKIVLTVLK